MVDAGANKKQTRHVSWERSIRLAGPATHQVVRNALMTVSKYHRCSPHVAHYIIGYCPRLQGRALLLSARLSVRLSVCSCP